MDDDNGDGDDDEDCDDDADDNDNVLVILMMMMMNDDIKNGRKEFLPSFYLRIGKAWEIWLKVEQNPFSSTIQSNTADEENKKNDKRKCGCEIHDLKCYTDVHGIKTLIKTKGR